MFGLGIGPKILWRKLQGNSNIVKLEKEIKAFFEGAAFYIINKHGAEIIHEAITIAVPVIKSMLSTNIPNQEKHSNVVDAIKASLGNAANNFSANDFADIISSGLSNVRREEEIKRNNP